MRLKKHLLGPESYQEFQETGPWLFQYSEMSEIRKTLN